MKQIYGFTVLVLVCTPLFAEQGQPPFSSSQDDSNSDEVIKDTGLLGLDGYCPVSLLHARDPRRAWIKGDAGASTIYRGRTYLFAGPGERDKFNTAPQRYAPALSCCDPIEFANNENLAIGKRRHCVCHRGRVFLFANEKNLKAFWQNPSRYSTIVREHENKQFGADVLLC